MEKEEREKERTFPQKVFPSRIGLTVENSSSAFDGMAMSHAKRVKQRKASEFFRKEKIAGDQKGLEKEEREKERTFPQKVFPSRIGLTVPDS